MERMEVEGEILRMCHIAGTFRFALFRERMKMQVKCKILETLQQRHHSVYRSIELFYPLIRRIQTIS